jgi:thioredoxin:protein disulfide reductase
MRVPPLVLATIALGAGLCLAPGARAKPWWIHGAESNDADYLPPDVAFRVSSGVDGNLIRVRWVIADGYYLYRQRMEIKAESPDLVVSAPSLPKGIVKTDPYLGTQETYEQQVDATVAYSRFDAGAHPLQVKVTYQGCAKAGLCYPPISKVLFPHAPLQAAAVNPSHPWQGWAILGGIAAFLGAGLILRKERTLSMPAA